MSGKDLKNTEVNLCNLSFIQREATTGAGEVISYLGWIDVNAQVSNMFFCWELISINSSMQLL